MPLSNQFCACLTVLLLVVGSGLPRASARRQLQKEHLVVTSDHPENSGVSLSGVRPWVEPPEDVGSKAIAVAISDAFAYVRRPCNLLTGMAPTGMSR